MTGGAGVADELVAGIGDQRRAGVGDECDCFGAHARDQAGADAFGIMVVIGNHRALCTDMAEQAGGDSAVLDRYDVGARQDVGGAGR